MKKGWKIALIALGSIIGLVLILLVAAFVTLKVMLTPDRLTKIVNDVAAEYVRCDSHFDRVELSLFETFPDVGLEVRGVYLVNPYQLPDTMPLATRAKHNDTLAHVGRLTLGVDAKAFLRHKQVVVHQLCLDDAQANLYTAPDGWSNLDVFATKEDKDTSSTKMDLVSVDLTKIDISNLSAYYCDLQSGMLAEVQGLDVDLHGRWQDREVNGDLKIRLQEAMLERGESLYVRLTDLDGKVDADGTWEDLAGKLKLALASADVTMNGTSYLKAETGKGDLLTVTLPFRADIDAMSMVLEKAKMEVMGYEAVVDGRAALAHDGNPMEVDMSLALDRWKLKELLADLPPVVTRSLKGMRIDGVMSVDAAAKGVVAKGRLPEVTAHVQLEKGSFAAPKLLPMPLSRIKGDIDVQMKENVDVKVASLSLKADNSVLNLNGRVDDVLGDMLVDAHVKGDLSLPDLTAFVPDTMNMELQGTSDMNIHLVSHLSALKQKDLKRVSANGTIGLKRLDVHYDSIRVASPEMTVGLTVGKALRKSADGQQVIGVDLKGGRLAVAMPTMDATVEQPDIQMTLPNLLDKKQALAAVLSLACGKIQASIDSTSVNVDHLALKGHVRNDKTQSNVIKKWNPNLDVTMDGATVSLASLTDVLRMPSFKFKYTGEMCEVSDVDLRIGVSDYHLYGRVYGLEDWLSHDDHLRGTLYFNSQYTDLDQLLDLLSGLGTDKDTLQRQREEDKVSKEANPFIVPKDVNMTLYTKIDRCLAYGNNLDNLAGTVSVADGAAVLDQMGFTCKAARMQLTGIYKSPRVNHLFAGLDFHLLDITVEELIEMVPTVDTLVPMLKAFKGKANFHLAAECNLDAFYKPKMSTLLGAAAISGENLVVMDNESISNIAKLLQLKDWRNRDNNLTIDSLSVEATVFRKEILVYPFALNLHNYTLCIDGRHTLDNACNYHMELIKCPLPLKMAVDVNGTLKNPKITLGSVKYAELFNPEKKNAVQARTLELKKMIRQALEGNVR